MPINGFKLFQRPYRPAPVTLPADFDPSGYLPVGAQVQSSPQSPYLTPRTAPVTGGSYNGPPLLPINPLTPRGLAVSNNMQKERKAGNTDRADQLEGAMYGNPEHAMQTKFAQDANARAGVESDAQVNAVNAQTDRYRTLTPLSAEEMRQKNTAAGLSNQNAQNLLPITAEEAKARVAAQQQQTAAAAQMAPVQVAQGQAQAEATRANAGMSKSEFDRLTKENADLRTKLQQYQKTEQQGNKNAIADAAVKEAENPALPSPAPAAAGANAGLPQVKTPAEAQKLPRGTKFIDPSGVVRIVP